MPPPGSFLSSPYDINEWPEALVLTKNESGLHLLAYKAIKFLMLEDTEDFEEKVYQYVNEILKDMGYV
jgi:hypothetical protein